MKDPGIRSRGEFRVRTWESANLRQTQRDLYKDTQIIMRLLYFLQLTLNVMAADIL